MRAFSQSLGAAVPSMASTDSKRFFNHPEVIPRYYQAMLDLMNEFFNPETLDPLIDRVVGGFAPADRINAMKQTCPTANRRRAGPNPAETHDR